MRPGLWCRAKKFARNCVSDGGVANRMDEEMRCTAKTIHSSYRRIRTRALGIGVGLGRMRNALFIERPTLRSVTRTNDDLQSAVLGRAGKHEAHREKAAHRERKDDQQI